MDKEWFGIRIVEIKENLRPSEWLPGLRLRVRRRRGAEARMGVGALSGSNAHEELVGPRPPPTCCLPQGPCPDHVHCPVLIEVNVIYIPPQKNAHIISVLLDEFSQTEHICIASTQIKNLEHSQHPRTPSPVPTSKVNLYLDLEHHALIVGLFWNVI